MAEAVPLSPQKDEGSPLPSPSNPDIETTETEQAQPSIIDIEQQENINDTNNIEDKQDDDDDNNTEIKPSISMILDTEPIPDAHIREAQMSTTKIMNVAKQLDQDKSPQNDDDNDDNEEKEEIQKQIQIKVEHGHTSKQGIRPSMEVLSLFILIFIFCYL